MNKGELIERLSGKLGDQKLSSRAVDAMIDEIEQAVSAGEKVNISGFGVFEKRERAARTARNPRTGEPIKVQKTSVPAFRPGTSFKTLVSGSSGSGSRSSSGNGSRGSGSRGNGSQGNGSRGNGSKGVSASSQAQPTRANSRGQSHAQSKAQQPRAQAQSPQRAQSTGQAQRASGRAQQTAYAQNNAVTVRRPTSHARAR